MVSRARSDEGPESPESGDVVMAVLRELTGGRRTPAARQGHPHRPRPRLRRRRPHRPDLVAPRHHRPERRRSTPLRTSKASTASSSTASASSGGRPCGPATASKSPAWRPCFSRPGPRPPLPPASTTVAMSGPGRLEVKPEAKLRAVLEISRHLSTALDLKDVLPKILECLFVVFPQADRGFILLQDPNTGQLAPKAVRKRREPDADTPAISRNIINQVLSTRQAVLERRRRVATSASTPTRASGVCTSVRSCAPRCSARRGPSWASSSSTRRSCGRRSARRTWRCWPAPRRRRRTRSSWPGCTRSAATWRPPHRSRRVSSRRRGRASRSCGFSTTTRRPARSAATTTTTSRLPGDRLAVALGDVSGKGVAAALLMARLSAAARFSLAAEPDAPTAMRRLNAVLMQGGRDDRFVTFVAAIFDLKTYQRDAGERRPHAAVASAAGAAGRGGSRRRGRGLAARRNGQSL